MKTQRDHFDQIIFTRQAWLTESQSALFSKFSSQLKRGTREEPTEEEVLEEEDSMVAIENFLEINLIEEELLHHSRKIISICKTYKYIIG